MLSYNEMISATRASLDARNAARDALATRIEDVVVDLLNLCDLPAVRAGGYTIATRPVQQDCSQWSNRIAYPIRVERRALIVEGEGRALARSLGPIDLGFSDGHNYQYARGPATLEGTDTVVRPATVMMLRAVAAALPGVAADAHDARRMMLDAQAEAAAAAAAALNAAAVK